MYRHGAAISLSCARKGGSGCVPDTILVIFQTSHRAQERGKMSHEAVRLCEVCGSARCKGAIEGLGGKFYRLSTKTALLAVITTLTLSIERILPLLVLSNLPLLVVPAVLVLAVGLDLLGEVNHLHKHWRQNPPRRTRTNRLGKSVTTHKLLSCGSITVRNPTEHNAEPRGGKRMLSTSASPLFPRYTNAHATSPHWQEKHLAAVAPPPIKHHTRESESRSPAV